MNAQNLITDKFKSAEFSRNELDLFTIDLISKIQKKTNAVLPKSEETLLVTCYQNFKSGLGQVATDSAVKKAGTITKEDAFDEVIDFIRRKEGVIKDLFPKGSPTYTEFYPAGLTEYNKAGVEGIKNLLVRYMAAAQKHKAALSPQFITDLTALENLYKDARDEQVDKISTNKSSITLVREARKALTMQLTRCLLQIASYTIENPEEFNSYFNFSLLEVDNDKTPTEPTETKK
jgi:hypothetical protein